MHTAVHEPGPCPSKKRTFATFAIAQKHSTRLAKKFARLLVSYQCRHCGLWHHTSKPDWGRGRTRA